MCTSEVGKLQVCDHTLISCFVLLNSSVRVRTLIQAIAKIAKLFSCNAAITLNYVQDSTLLCDRRHVSTFSTATDAHIEKWIPWLLQDAYPSLDLLFGDYRFLWYSVNTFTTLS